MINFEVPGRAIAYTRTTQRGAYFDKAYKKYQAYKDHVKIHAKLAMQKQGFQYIESGIPIEMGYRVYIGPAAKRGVREGDLSNYLKGAEDALNKVLFHDDKWIQRFIFLEKIKVNTVEEERAEIIIKRMETAMKIS